MTGFEPGSSGIGSDRSANCATTTAHCVTALLQIDIVQLVRNAKGKVLLFRCFYCLNFIQRLS